MLTAISRDQEFADGVPARRPRPQDRPRRTHIFERARERGEIRPDVDLDLLAPALAGIILHRLFVLGEHPTRTLIARVIDQIILPAAHRPRTGH